MSKIFGLGRSGDATTSVKSLPGCKSGPTQKVAKCLTNELPAVTLHKDTMGSEWGGEHSPGGGAPGGRPLAVECSYCGRKWYRHSKNIEFYWQGIQATLLKECTASEGSRRVLHAGCWPGMLSGAVCFVSSLVVRAKSK